MLRLIDMDSVVPWRDCLTEKHLLPIRKGSGEDCASLKMEIVDAPAALGS